MTPVDELLKTFLDENATNRAKGFTLANLFIKLERWQSELDQVKEELKTLREAQEEYAKIVDEHDDRLTAHRKQIVIGMRDRRERNNASFSGDELDTGQFDVVAIQREVQDLKQRRMNSERIREEKSTWWKRHFITVITGALVSAFGVVLVVILTLAVAGAKQQVNPQINQPTINSPPQQGK